MGATNQIDDRVITKRKAKTKRPQKNKKRKNSKVPFLLRMGASKLINDRIITKRKAKTKRPPKNKKRKNSEVPFLPDEIIFHIFLRLSADILFNTMRCVCKQWHNIIKDPLFINEHLSVHSRYYDGIGFHCHSDENVYFAHFGGEKEAKLSKLMTLPYMSEVLSICDGLILFRCETSGKAYVANPVTKQLVTLPSLGPEYISSKYWLSRVGNSSKMEYKVLFACYFFDGTVCGVMTLGKDETWRKIDTLPSYFEDFPSITAFLPLQFGKFFHWISRSYSGMVTFDVELELFITSSIHIPNFINKSRIFRFFVRGGCVTIMIGLRQRLLWEVWSLARGIDGEWNKLFEIDFRDKKYRRISKVFRKGEVFPVAWIDNDVVVFQDHSSPVSFIYHNIKTGDTYQVMSCYYHSRTIGVYTPYASTLVSPI